MTTFDELLPRVANLLRQYSALINDVDWLIVNRDLNGRIRLIAPSAIEGVDTKRLQLEELYRSLISELAPHVYPDGAGILYESTRAQACNGTSSFELEGLSKVYVIDRLATESRWESIAAVSNGVPRIVFFSIKGGVGRSTALAANAWALAQQGKRVLVLDLDLESPGLSSALLSNDRQPIHGITDWLVEDLVNNGDVLINDMYATSGLQTEGDIYLVPAHGVNPGEYVSKLGRVWMPKITDGQPENWSSRLNRLVTQLESQINPDAILIDSRAGIDEVASACVTDLGAHTILMFAIQGQQTWTGYRALFNHWQQRGVITDIRDRLQLVAGLVPDDERRLDYLSALRTDAYGLFESTYDEVEAGEISGWSFEEGDDNAPHAPLPIRWNRGWYGLLSLQHRMVQIDKDEVESVYGKLLDFVNRALVQENES